MLVLGIYQIFDGIRIIYAGALRGLKDTRFSMYTSFVSFWLIGIVFAYIFGFSLHGQGVGVWWGLTLGVFTGTFILFFRLKYMLHRV